MGTEMLYRMVRWRRKGQERERRFWRERERDSLSECDCNGIYRDGKVERSLGAGLILKITTHK